MFTVVAFHDDCLRLQHCFCLCGHESETLCFVLDFPLNVVVCVAKLICAATTTHILHATGHQTTHSLLTQLAEVHRRYISARWIKNKQSSTINSTVISLSDQLLLNHLLMFVIRCL